MASAETSGVQGQSPWSGGQGGKAPEAESFEAFAHLTKAKKIAVNMPRPSQYGIGSLQTDATVTNWPTGSLLFLLDRFVRVKVTTIIHHSAKQLH